MNEEISISITVVTLCCGLKTLLALPCLCNCVRNPETQSGTAISKFRIRLCGTEMKVFCNLRETLFKNLLGVRDTLGNMSANYAGVFPRGAALRRGLRRF